MQRLRSALPPLSALRAFEAAVRLGSFKAASQDLLLTQSAISHQIRSLETHFRTKLFRRQGNKVILSLEGATYGASIQKIFADLQRAGELLLNKNREETVRVSASPSFAMFAALPNAQKFRVKNADLDLRLEARNTSVDFDTELVDAAIQVGTPPFPGLQSHRIFRSELGPVAHPDLCRRYQPIKSVKDLARLPLIELHPVPKTPS
jgi:LysR family glycine cleavage system transcriptional activator